MGSRIQPKLVTSHLDRAIKEGRLDAAWRQARLLPHVTLDRALRLTVLMADQSSPGYAGAARKFLARFMSEYKPSMRLVTDVAGALAGLERHLSIPQAREELLELADRIADQEVQRWQPGGTPY